MTRRCKYCGTTISEVVVIGRREGLLERLGICRTHWEELSGNMKKALYSLDKEEQIPN